MVRCIFFLCVFELCCVHSLFKLNGLHVGCRGGMQHTMNQGYIPRPISIGFERAAFFYAVGIVQKIYYIAYGNSRW